MTETSKENEMSEYGTVAMLSGMDGEEGREYLGVKEASGDDWRVFDSADPKFTRWNRPPKVRPLVVIDPEDIGQVASLREAFRTRDCLPGDKVDDWQAAVREYVNPTPPKEVEPTGSFASVRSPSWGHAWMRSGRDNFQGLNWVGDDGEWSKWDDLPDDVVVLSEGVTPDE